MLGLRLRAQPLLILSTWTIYVVTSFDQHTFLKENCLTKVEGDSSTKIKINSLKAVSLSACSFVKTSLIDSFIGASLPLTTQWDPISR